LDLRQLGLTGPVAVRDLWRQKELGMKSSPVDFLIPAHGVILIKLND
jgi:hypothetical protein